MNKLACDSNLKFVIDYRLVGFLLRTCEHAYDVSELSRFTTLQVPKLDFPMCFKLCKVLLVGPSKESVLKMKLSH